MIVNERGFTLVEILVSVAIFAIIVIGAIGVLGATNTGGFLEGFPTAFVTERVAKDMTAAATFLQSFQEYAANVAATLGDATLIPDSYCDGADCTTTPPVITTPISSSGLSGAPAPPTEAYQLDWRRLDVTIERWYWDAVAQKYCKVEPAPPAPGCGAMATTEFLTRVQSTLTWRIRGTSRSITVDRFLP